MNSVPKNFKATVNRYFPFDDEHLARIFARFQKKELNKGSKLVKIGEVSSELIFIESGILKEY